MTQDQQKKLEFIARHRGARRQDIRIACAPDTSDDAIRKQLDDGLVEKGLLKTFGSGKCKGYQIANAKVAATFGALPSACRAPGAEKALPTVLAISEYMARLIHAGKVKRGLLLRSEFETHFQNLTKDGVAFEPCYAVTTREAGCARLERYDVDLGSVKSQARISAALLRLRAKSKTLAEMMDCGVFALVVITTPSRRALLKNTKLTKLTFDGYPARVELVASDILQTLGR